MYDNLDMISKMIRNRFVQEKINFSNKINMRLGQVAHCIIEIEARNTLRESGI